MGTNVSPKQRLKRARAATGTIAKELFREMAPKVLFFFSAFGLLFLLFKLFVAQYSIQYSAFAKAAFAALILGKVVPLLDWAQSGYRFETYRRIVVIICKTTVYAIVVIVLGIGERILEALRKQGSLSAAFDFLIVNSNTRRFLGLVLLISLVVGAYLMIQELDNALGEGTILRVLFERPSDWKCGTNKDRIASAGKI
jgi:hypothetical protein